MLTPWLAREPTSRKSLAYHGSTFHGWSALNEVTYREFEDRDWPAVERLLAENDADLVRTREVLGTPFARAWLAEAGEEVVGWILTRPVTTEEGYDLGGVEDLVVDPDYRDNSIARRLMILAEEHYRAQGKAAMQLTVRADNTVALDLYRSLGYSIKEASLRMRKSLGPDPRTVR